jgi:hypothetical protein
MSSDQDFKVSGDDDALLAKTIDLAFHHHNPYTNNATAKSWAVIPSVGMVFYWGNNLTGANNLPVPLNAEGVSSIVTQWLKTDEASRMQRSHEYQGGDGSYGSGWEVTNYHYGPNVEYQILIVRPVEIYYSK